MDGISIEEDDERIIAILASIDDDDRSPAGGVLEVWEERERRNRERPGGLRIVIAGMFHMREVSWDGGNAQPRGSML